MSEIKEIIQNTISNLTQNATEAAKKTPASPEGMAVAYGSLMVMAVFPVFLGAVRSVKYHKGKLQKDKTIEKLTYVDAALFPFLASASLLLMYFVFKVFSIEDLNRIITAYFYCLGVFALCHILSPVMSKLIPGSISKVTYRLKFTKGTGKSKVIGIDYSFTNYDIICLVSCALLGLWYLLKKHWIANNLFGIAFAINGVEMLMLNNMLTGCILLGGLFVYDIFWVFYTDVMVTVAKSFEAPIKLVFPQDILENGFAANNFAMLGLGDIVVPGIFIALLLRFDHSLNRNKSTYFYASFFAYILGLCVTIFVMHMFKHAQPALLYLVPACLGIPSLLALINGDISALFKYEDYPKEGGNGKPPKEKKPKTDKSNSNNNSNADSKTSTPTNSTKKKSQSVASPKESKKKK